ncbi:MAG: hypothetical protein IPM39_26095 [Chloroflexi bacterium]|nr:hypothetical protein [Chloroflexota bacterium]
MEVLMLLLILSVVVLLVIIFRPRRSPYVSRTAKTRNGLPRWKEHEPY